MSKHAHVKPYPKEFRDQVVRSVQLGDCSTLEVAKALDTEVYFARPYRSCDHGQNEHANGLVRPYFGKPESPRGRPRNVLRLPHLPGGLLADRPGLGHLGHLTAPRRPGSAPGNIPAKKWPCARRTRPPQKPYSLDRRMRVIVQLGHPGTTIPNAAGEGTSPLGGLGRGRSIIDAIETNWA